MTAREFGEVKATLAAQARAQGFLAERVALIGRTLTSHGWEVPEPVELNSGDHPRLPLDSCCSRRAARLA